MGATVAMLSIPLFLTTLDFVRKWWYQDVPHRSLFSSYTVHSVQITGTEDHAHGDLRADRNALKDIKHTGKYFQALYTQTSPWGFLLASRRLHGSLELVTQAKVAANSKFSSSPDTVYDRMERTAATIQTVNLDRTRSLQAKPLAQDSALVAYAIHMQEAQERETIPFPRAPPERKPTDNPSPSFYEPALMDTGSMKSVWVPSHLQNLTRQSLTYGTLILCCVQLLQSQQDHIVEIFLCLMPTAETQSHLLVEPLKDLLSKLPTRIQHFTTSWPSLLETFAQIT
jgi:hypothetical protein